MCNPHKRYHRFIPSKQVRTSLRLYYSLRLFMSTCLCNRLRRWGLLWLGVQREDDSSVIISIPPYWKLDNEKLVSSIRRRAHGIKINQNDKITLKIIPVTDIKAQHSLGTLKHVQFRTYLAPCYSTNFLGSIEDIVAKTFHPVSTHSSIQ